MTHPSGSSRLRCPIRRFSPDDGAEYFFGYYDKCPWDPVDGSRLLAHRVEGPLRPPRAGDRVAVGWIAGGQFHRAADTAAWNFQQGAMLQWRGNSRRILFNDSESGKASGIEIDPESGARRTFPLPLANVSRDGRWALSLNFARLAKTRPGYGYEGIPDPFEREAVSAEDGIHLLDLDSGEHRRLFSVADVAAFQPSPDMAEGYHFLNHTYFTPSAARFMFFHLYRLPNGDVRTRLLTANRDGSGMRVLLRGMVSHYDWLSETELLAWAGERALLDSGGAAASRPTLKSRIKKLIPVTGLKKVYRALGKPRWLMNRVMKDRYILFDDAAGTRRVLAPKDLVEDGHCTFSPNREWLCADTYPSGKRWVTLKLFHLPTGRVVELGTIFSPSEFEDELRCDLHPRWSRDGRRLCVDSAHTGSRQIYELDVAALLG